MNNSSEDNSIGGLVFVACMFIGAGIGMLFNETAAGGAIGMGIGFLIMAILRSRKIEEKPLELRLPKTLGDLIMVFLGLVMIAVGILVLYNPKLIFPYLPGIAAIIFGIIILLIGLSNIRSR